MEKKSTFRELVCALPQKTNLDNIASLSASKLCEHCRAVVPDRTKVSREKIPTEFERVDTFPDFPELKASGKAGCELCRLLRKTIRSTWSSQPFLESDYSEIAEGELEWERLLESEWDGKVKIHRLRFHFESFGGFQFGSRMTFGEDTGADEQHGGMVTGMTVEVGPVMVALDEEGEALGGEVGKQLHFKVYDSVDLTRSNASSRRQLPDPETLSSRNVKMMKEWIGECKENHGESCQFQDHWVPTRLLYLGPDATSLPQLMTTAAHDCKEVKYATLSHLWGEKPDESCPLQCLESNLEEFSAGIELDQLNANFKDAIAVCRALEIQHLWIDALCIVQDSEEDREREAAFIHKVFRNSEVTLVATSAVNPQSGFLRRNLVGTPAIKIEYGLGEAQESLILSHTKSLSDGTREIDVESSPWTERGWPMIERALSNRLIYFCKNRLYFECRLSLRSEEFGTESMDGRISPLWPRTNDTDKESSRPFFYQAWQNFLAEFSGKKMLRPSDRLIAMTNVASEMGEYVADTFMEDEGTWFKNLRKDLLWYNEEAPVGRASLVEVPSWSWVKVNQKVGFCRGATDGELQYPFKGKKNPPFALKQYDGEGGISATGYCKRFSKLQHIDTDDDFLVEMRKEYPYDLVIDQEEEEPTILAQGQLDFDDLDVLVASGKELSYLHVEAETHPTGLIVVDVGEGRVRRVGVATVFDFGGELLMDPPFGKGDMKDVCLV